MLKLNWKCTTLPGGLVQHRFHLVYLISTKVDNGKVNPAILLDAHLPETMKNIGMVYTPEHHHGDGM